MREAGRPNPDVLRQMLRKAEEKLQAADLAFQHGLFGEVSSRAYYAVYHAVCAVLAAHGLSFASHGQTLGAFNRDFVRTGRFRADAGRRLNRLFENRQVADYDWSVEIEQEDARADLQDARALVRDCRDYLARETGERMVEE